MFGSAAISVWLLNTYSIKNKKGNDLSVELGFKVFPSPYIKYSIPINLK